MDFQAIITLLSLIALILLLPLIFIIFTPSPSLPGPPLRDYLPGGTVQKLFKDVRLLGQVVTELETRYGHVFHFWLGPVRVVNTSHYQDVAQIISSADDFGRAQSLRVAMAAIAPGGLFTMQGSTHKEARRLLREKFNHSMLEGFQGKMHEAVVELCDSLAQVAGKEPVCISNILATTTFRVITNVAFGSGMDKQDRLQFNVMANEVVDEIMKELIGYPLRQWLDVFGSRNRLFELKRKIYAACLVFIERRLEETQEQKNSRRPDMLDAILEISGDDAELITALTVEFALAGSHTTNQILTWAICEITGNPGVLVKLQNELDAVVGHKPLSEPLTLEDMKMLKYLTQVWKETLRRRPIASTLLRVANRNIQLKGSGIRVKKGTVVQALILACQTDPEQWNNPLEFRPERWGEGRSSEANRVPGGSYIPFGVGQLSCVGRFLADYEGPLLIAELFRRFSFELDCKYEEIISRTCFVESPRCLQGDKETEILVKVVQRQT